MNRPTAQFGISFHVSRDCSRGETEICGVCEALRADLLAGIGEAGQRVRQAKPVGMVGAGLRQTPKRAAAPLPSSTITIIIGPTSASTDAPYLKDANNQPIETRQLTAQYA